MLVDGIELSPEAAGTLATLVENGRVSTVTRRKFIFGPAGDELWLELVQAGLVEQSHIIGSISRYELLRDVTLPNVEFSSGKVAPDRTVTLTDEQREQLAQERQNDSEISHAIDGGKHEKSKFDSRCLGNYGECHQ